MFTKIRYKLIYMIEKRINKLRVKLLDRTDAKFNKQHSFKDASLERPHHPTYNPFENTRISLLETLFKSGHVNVNSTVYDVGCGTAKAMVFFASKAVKEVHGVEYQKKYVDLSITNLDQAKKMYPETIFNLRLGEAEKLDVSDQVDFVYLFNPFNSEELYCEFLDKLKASWQRNKRKIKIALLYPTQKSRAAFKNQRWLRPVDRVYDTNQPCFKCVYYQIYESETNDAGNK